MKENSSNKLDYSKGKDYFSFSKKNFEFKEIILKELNHKINNLLNPKIKQLYTLEKLHELEVYKENCELLRQVFFDIFREDKFQNIYKSFTKYIVNTYFDGRGFIQKIPTIRIQFPGSISTSYHADKWYGHSIHAKTFWIPLVNVNDKNSLNISKNNKLSDDLEKKIIKNNYSLEKINQLSPRICNPFISSYGNGITFNSSMIHGTNENISKYTRVSFDFRIAPDFNSIGDKPSSNYFSFNEQKEDLKLLSNKSKIKGITYSNNCQGISAKTQIIVCNSFAKDNNISVDGNESEILAFSHLPVLNYYLKDSRNGRNCIVLFGIQIFNNDFDLAIYCYEKAIKYKKTFVFSAQGLIIEANELNKNKFIRLFK